MVHDRLRVVADGFEIHLQAPDEFIVTGNAFAQITGEISEPAVFPLFIFLLQRGHDPGKRFKIIIADGVTDQPLQIRISFFPDQLLRDLRHLQQRINILRILQIVFMKHFFQQSHGLTPRFFFPGTSFREHFLIRKQSGPWQQNEQPFSCVG